MAPSTTRMIWHDLGFQVRAREPAVVDYIRSQHQLVEGETNTAASWITIDAVVSAGQLAELASRPVTERRESHAGWWYDCHRDGEIFTLVAAEGHEFGHALTTEDFAHWRVVAAHEEDLGLVVTRTVRELVREHFVGRGALMLHGAAAVLPDGTGTVLAGSSGAGKTSAAVQLAMAGGRCVATDRCLLLPEGDRWVVIGLPLSTRLTVETAASLGIDAGAGNGLIRHGKAAVRRPDPKGKISLSNGELRRLANVGMVASAVVDSLVLLENTGVAEPSSTVISRPEVVAGLKEHFLVPDPAYRCRWLAPDPAPEPAVDIETVLNRLGATTATLRAEWTPATYAGDVLATWLITSTEAPGEPLMTVVPQIRHSARALLLDEDGRLLLFSGEDEAGTFWYPVGGGIEAGESPEEALRREIKEETGQTEVEIGPQVWYREALASWGGKTYDCRERIYLCPIPHFAIDTSGFTASEIDTVLGHRWWTQEELATTTDRLVPMDLAARLRTLLTDGTPDEPEFVGT